MVANAMKFGFLAESRSQIRYLVSLGGGRQHTPRSSLFADSHSGLKQADLFYSYDHRDRETASIGWHNLTVRERHPQFHGNPVHRQCHGFDLNV